MVLLCPSRQTASRLWDGDTTIGRHARSVTTEGVVTKRTGEPRGQFVSLILRESAHKPLPLIAGRDSLSARGGQGGSIDLATSDVQICIILGGSTRVLGHNTNACENLRLVPGA
jgi:hypothetical protein